MRFGRKLAWLMLSVAACLSCGCPAGDRAARGQAGQSSSSADESPHPRLGTEPPEVVAKEWLNAEGPQTLAELKGQVVLIEFWATWCGPCRDGIPHMNAIHAKHADAGLRILSFTQEDRRTVERFQKGAKPPIEYTIGIGSKLSETYGVEGIPHAFLIGRDGILHWEGHPADPEMERKIEKALAHE